MYARAPSISVYLDNDWDASTLHDVDYSAAPAIAVRSEAKCCLPEEHSVSVVEGLSWRQHSLLSDSITRPIP